MNTINNTSIKEKIIRNSLFLSACFLAYFFGKKILKYRYALPSKKDKRDYTLAPSGATTYPDFFNVPQPPPENQGNVNSCHDDQTEVLTRFGWKFFKDITYEDLLASVNPKDGNLIWEKPTNIIKEKYVGKMVKVKHESMDYVVTPNHDMIVKKHDVKTGKLSEEYFKIKAMSLPWWAGYRTEFHQKNNNTSGKVTLTEELVSNGNTLCHQEIDLSDWVEFLGIYLAEGTMCNILHHYRIQIAGVKKRERDYIEALLGRMGVNASSYKDRYVIHNKRLWMKLNDLGLYRVKSYNKYIPDFIFDLDETLIEKFLYGFAMGDGHFSKEGGVVYATSSPKMAEQLQILMLISGKNARMYITDNIGKECKLKDGRSIIAKHLTHIIRQWKGVKSSSGTRNYSLIPYDGIVYCAEVPTYHTLITKRNGQILMSGNCVAHSCSYVCESVMNKRDSLPDRHFATGFVYGYRPAGYYQGQGMYPREALKTLQEVGNVPKQVFSYNVEVPQAIEMVNKRMGELRSIAVNFRIKTYFKLETEENIKDCLMKFGPVSAMFPVYKCLEAPVDGKVEYDGGVVFRGYHQMTIYGWSGRYWKILNSWGGVWGGDNDNDGATLVSMTYPLIEAWGVSTDLAGVVKPAKKTWTTIFCPWRW